MFSQLIEALDMSLKAAASWLHISGCYCDFCQALELRRRGVDVTLKNGLSVDRAINGYYDIWPKWRRTN